MTDALSADLFEAHVGSTFTAAVVPATELTLVAVERLPEQPQAPRQQPFTLTFTAAAGTSHPQATFPLEHAVLGRLELFLVPRRPLADGLARYEADIN